MSQRQSLSLPTDIHTSSLKPKKKPAKIVIIKLNNTRQTVDATSRVTRATSKSLEDKSENKQTFCVYIGIVIAILKELRELRELREKQWQTIKNKVP